jgi:hypothetical protein
MKSLFILLPCLALLPLGGGVAQDSTSIPPTETASPPYRDPQRARAFAKLLPGAGHIYSGEYLRGYGYWVGAASGITVGAALYDQPCAFAGLVELFTTAEVDWGCDNRWSSHLTGIALVSLGAWAWVSSVRDAPRAAERANTRHARRSPNLAPLLRAPSAQGGRWRAGVTVGW